MAPNTRTLNDVLRYAKAQFGDTSGVQITDDDIARAVNSACNEIVIKNKVLRTTGTTSLVTDQDEYDKPADCLQITAVRYGRTMLEGVGYDEFQHNDYGDSITNWSQYGNKLVVGGIPIANETDALKIYYVPRPAKVAVAGDLLPVPDRYYERVCEYVMAKLYELDEDWQAQGVNKKAFEDNLASLNFEEVNREGPFNTVIPYDL